MELLMTAPLQTVLGIAAAFIFFRRCGYVAMSVIIVVFLWIYSVGQTSGGLFLSMRVLSPALIMLSILGGGLLAGLAVKKWRYGFIAIFLFCVCLLASIQNLVIPFSSWRLPMRYWLSAGFFPLHDPGIHILDCVDKVSVNARILSDNAFVHAVLCSRPSRTVSIVPVWSPEVEFLFYEEKAVETACRDLRRHGINYVLYSPDSLNNVYLENFPFFAGYREISIPLYEGKHGILYELSDDTNTDLHSKKSGF